RWPRDWSSDVCSSDLLMDSITNSLQSCDKKSGRGSRGVPLVSPFPKRFVENALDCCARKSYNNYKEIEYVFNTSAYCIILYEGRSEERRVGKECRCRR